MPENGDEQAPFIRVTFTPDGNVNINSEQCGPGQFFVAAKMVELVGERMFMEQQLQEAARQPRNRISVPGRTS